MLISEIPEINSITVVPSSGDESLVFGSWFLSNLNNQKNQISQVNGGADSGLLIGTQYHQKYLSNFKENIANNYNPLKIYEDNINDKASCLLSKGKIGARFSGRMEFGARSLGNRSIICSPYSMIRYQLLMKL